jgi:hypothetical protein
MTEHIAVIALRAAIALVGALVAFWSFRMAHRFPKARGPYLLLAAGFGVFTLGTVIEGALFEFAGWDLVLAHAAEAFLSAIGFSLILLGVVRSRV